MTFQREQREHQGLLLTGGRLFSAAAATRDDDHSRRNSHLLALGFFSGGRFEIHLAAVWRSTLTT